MFINRGEKNLSYMQYGIRGKKKNRFIIVLNNTKKKKDIPPYEIFHSIFRKKFFDNPLFCVLIKIIINKVLYFFFIYYLIHTTITRKFFAVPIQFPHPLPILYITPHPYIKLTTSFLLTLKYFSIY